MAHWPIQAKFVLIWESAQNMEFIKRKERTTKKVSMSFSVIDAEIRREMLSVLDRLVEEITRRFERLHDIENKYIFHTPSIL